MLQVTQVVFQEKSSQKRPPFNLGSIIIMHSNNSRVFLLGFTGSLLLIRELSSPAQFSAVILTVFLWGDTNPVTTAKWVGTTVGLNQPQRKLKDLLI